MENEDERLERVARQLGVLSDIVEYEARRGRVDGVKVIAKLIYDEAYREYAKLDGRGDMGGFFLDWTKDYECGGPIYLELLNTAKENSWKQA